MQQKTHEFCGFMKGLTIIDRSDEMDHVTVRGSGIDLEIQSGTRYYDGITNNGNIISINHG